MPYLRTRQGTDFSAETLFAERAVRVALTAFIPSANPDYDGKLHLVSEWLIECDESGTPWREVGVGNNGVPVVSGPDDRNYGFWCDTNMKFQDFEAEALTKEEFEAMWHRAAPLRHGEVPSAARV